MIIFAAFLILSPFLLPSPVKERILFTFQQKREYGQIQIGAFRLDTSTSERVQGWQRAVIDSVGHPFFGHGVTGYRFLDAQYPKVLVETGLLGLTAFFFLIYSIYKLALRSLRQLKTPTYIGLTTGFIAGFTGLLFHALGANTFIIVRIMEPFWLVAAIVTVLPELEKQRPVHFQMS
jgi:O-antigen ligase